MAELKEGGKMYTKKSRGIFILLVCLGITLAFSTYLLINTLAATPLTDGSPYPPPGASDTGTQSPESICADLYPSSIDLPPDKLAIEKEDYQRCVDAHTSPVPTNGIQPSPLLPSDSTTVANIPRRRAGAGTIVETSLAPFPSYYLVRNQWYMEEDNRIIRVFAGAQKGDGAVSLEKPWPGLVAIVVSMPGTNKFISSEGGIYWTPVKDGPVRIIDADGKHLTLLSENGQIFVFDVTSRQFIQQETNISISRPAGSGRIVENGDTPITLRDFIIYNQWYEEKNGNRITIFAGIESNNDRQGILVVVTTSLDQQVLISKEIFEAPLAIGPLRIFDVDGEKLTVIAGGNIFVFDVGARKYIALPDVPPDTLPLPTSGASTLTPLLTPSPQATATPISLPYP